MRRFTPSPRSTGKREEDLRPGGFRMDPIRSTLIVLIGVLLPGCAPKSPPPAPADQAAIRERLGQYSRAWRAGDVQDLAEAMDLHSADDRTFASVLGRMRLAHMELVRVGQEAAG